MPGAWCRRTSPTISVRQALQRPVDFRCGHQLALFYDFHCAEFYHKPADNAV